VSPVELILTEEGEGGGRGAKPRESLALYKSFYTVATHSKTEKERELADEIGVGRGAKSCDREKAWSSINHSILSVSKTRRAPAEAEGKK
jgi:hypothetical protein